MSTTEKMESAEAWRELAREVRVALLDYWTLENDPKNELRMLRVVRALDAIQARERKEDGK
jgi:hypothetical protein